MSAPRLPELPEARIVSYQTNSTMRTMELRTYSEFDMRAYGEAAWAAAMEAAAQICAEQRKKWDGPFYRCAEVIEAAIRDAASGSGATQGGE